MVESSSISTVDGVDASFAVCGPRMQHVSSRRFAIIDHRTSD